MERTYNGNQKSGSGYQAPNKSAGVAGKAKGGAPAKDFTPSPKGTQPKFLLKVKETSENGEASFRILTGLFENTSKDGQVFYKGVDRNSGAEFFVMPKLDDSSGN